MGGSVLLRRRCAERSSSVPSSPAARSSMPTSRSRHAAEPYSTSTSSRCTRSLQRGSAHATCSSAGRRAGTISPSASATLTSCSWGASATGAPGLWPAMRAHSRTAASSWCYPITHVPTGPPPQSFRAEEEKWDLLGRAKILINIHQDEFPYFEWLRVVQAMSNGAVVVSERSVDFEPLVPGVTCSSASRTRCTCSPSYSSTMAIAGGKCRPRPTSSCATNCGSAAVWSSFWRPLRRSPSASRCPTPPTSSSHSRSPIRTGLASSRSPGARPPRRSAITTRG